MRQSLDEFANLLLPRSRIPSRFFSVLAWPLDDRAGRRQFGSDIFQPIAKSPRRKTVVTIVALNGSPLFRADAGEVAELQTCLDLSQNSRHIRKAHGPLKRILKAPAS
jgi:hypothetical protein